MPIVLVLSVCGLLYVFYAVILAAKKISVNFKSSCLCALVQGLFEALLLPPLVGKNLGTF